MEPVLASGLCHVIVRKNTVGVRDARIPHIHTVDGVNIYG